VHREKLGQMQSTPTVQLSTWVLQLYPFGSVSSSSAGWAASSS
jgi:hypothetical protein